MFTFLSKATAGIFEFDIFSASGNYNCFGIFLIIITVRSSTLVMIFSFLQIFVAFLFQRTFQIVKRFMLCSDF